jgi:hypothetical protein
LAIQFAFSSNVAPVRAAAAPAPDLVPHFAQELDALRSSGDTPGLLELLRRLMHEHVVDTNTDVKSRHIVELRSSTVTAAAKKLLAQSRNQHDAVIAPKITVKSFLAVTQAAHWGFLDAIPVFPDLKNIHPPQSRASLSEQVSADIFDLLERDPTLRSAESTNQALGQLFQYLFEQPLVRSRESIMFMLLHACILNDFAKMLFCLQINLRTEVKSQLAPNVSNTDLLKPMTASLTVERVLVELLRRRQWKSARTLIQAWYHVESQCAHRLQRRQEVLRTRVQFDVLVLQAAEQFVHSDHAFIVKISEYILQSVRSPDRVSPVIAKHIAAQLCKAIRITVHMTAAQSDADVECVRAMLNQCAKYCDKLPADLNALHSALDNQDRDSLKMAVDAIVVASQVSSSKMRKRWHSLDAFTYPFDLFDIVAQKVAVDTTPPAANNTSKSATSSRPQPFRRSDRARQL